MLVLEGKSAMSSKPRPRRRWTTSSAFPRTARICGDYWWPHALDEYKDHRGRARHVSRLFKQEQLSHSCFSSCYFLILPKCSVTPGSRSVLAGAVNARAPAAPALHMADVAEATEAEPTVMRPPIDMPWESISDQVRRRYSIELIFIGQCNCSMLLRYLTFLSCIPPSK